LSPLSAASSGPRVGHGATQICERGRIRATTMVSGYPIISPHKATCEGRIDESEPRTWPFVRRHDPRSKLALPGRRSSIPESCEGRPNCTSGSESDARAASPRDCASGRTPRTTKLRASVRTLSNKSASGPNVKNSEAASIGNRACCCERRIATPAVLRRSERRRFFSANDDEVGGSKARCANSCLRKLAWAPPSMSCRGPLCSRS
jgi:hypothetical protein